MFHTAGRRSSRGVLVVLASLLAVPTASTAASGRTERDFRAGAFAIDITPEFPISMNGGMTDRTAKRAHDRLHARCLVLDDGETTIALAVCDSCMIPRDIFDAAKERASKKTGIRASRMLTSATHTHTAPTATGVFQSEPDEGYRRLLVERIAEGIARAHANLEPAKIGWAVGRDPSQVYNRRWFVRDAGLLADPFGSGSDKVRMNPPRGSAALDEPAGPIDPEVCLLSVQSRSGRPIAVLANYSLHYVGGVPGGAVSADYFGEFARRFTALIGANETKPPFVGIMSNGTSGDINNVNFTLKAAPRREPFEQIKVVAASVALAAHKAYRTIEYRDRAPIAMKETEIELGVRLPDDDDLAAARRILAEAEPPYRTRPQIYARETLLLANYPPKVKVKLQAIRIGELGIVSSPCETFVETGLAIKKHSPLKPTFVIELANGYNGYLPTPEQHALGGYETWRARSSYLAVDAEPKLRATLLRLLKEAAGE